MIQLVLLLILLLLKFCYLLLSVGLMCIILLLVRIWLRRLKIGGRGLIIRKGLVSPSGRLMLSWATIMPYCMRIRW